MESTPFSIFATPFAGIISDLGIICGPIWGSFAVLGSFAGRDYLRACTYKPNSCPPTWGAIVGSGNCLVVFHNHFFPFLSLFKLPKISLKVIFTPALNGL